jgi:hypothetical protein
VPSERIVLFTWQAESVQKDRLSRRQGMVTRERLRRRGRRGADAPPQTRVCVRGHPRSTTLVFSMELGGVGDPAQTILETGVQISEQGLGVHI